jgi:hypothetical protein
MPCRKGKYSKPLKMPKNAPRTHRQLHALLGSFTMDPIERYFSQFTFANPQLPHSYQHQRNGT